MPGSGDRLFKGVPAYPIPHPLLWRRKPSPESIPVPPTDITHTQL